MARRFSSSQLRSKLRQAQQKQRQAITKYNEAVRRHNQGVRTAVNRYNQVARTYNERVRANRRRLASELARLTSQPTITTRYVVYRTSVRTLQKSYNRLEASADSQQLDARYNRLLDLSEREAANSAEVTNHILGDQEAGSGSVDGLADADLLDGACAEFPRTSTTVGTALSSRCTRRIPTPLATSVLVRGKFSRRFSS